MAFVAFTADKRFINLTISLFKCLPIKILLSSDKRSQKEDNGNKKPTPPSRSSSKKGLEAVMLMGFESIFCSFLNSKTGQQYQIFRDAVRMYIKWIKIVFERILAHTVHNYY